MLNEDYIFLNIDVSTKDDVLRFISHQAKIMNITDDEEKLYNDFIARENEFPTGLQDGFAIPHARTENVKDIAIMYLTTMQDIEWGTLDEKPVKHMFALLVPSHHDGNIHLQMISKLATCLLEDDFKTKIKSSQDKAELKEYILKEMEV